MLGWQDFSQSNLGTHETASKTFSARTYVEHSKGGVCVTPEVSAGKGVKARAEMSLAHRPDSVECWSVNQGLILGWTLPCERFPPNSLYHTHSWTCTVILSDAGVCFYPGYQETVVKALLSLFPRCQLTFLSGQPRIWYPSVPCTHFFTPAVHLPSALYVPGTQALRDAAGTRQNSTLAEKHTRTESVM